MLAIHHARAANSKLRAIEFIS